MSPMKGAVAASVGLLVASWGCSDDGDAGNGAPGAEGRDLVRELSADDERGGVPGDAEPLSPNGSGEDGDVVQSDSDANRSDLERIAEGTGWALEEAQLYQDETDAAGEVSERLARERPDVFVGGAVGPEPSDAPRMYIKGVADEQVHEIVGAAPIEIRVIDRQPYSFIEIQERQSLLVDELLAMGFLDFAVGTDIQREGLMEVTLQRAEGAPGSADEILAALPAALRERISIMLVDEPVYVYN